MRVIKKITVGITFCVVSAVSYAQLTPSLPSSVHTLTQDNGFEMTPEVERALIGTLKKFELRKNAPVICSLEKGNCLDGNQVAHYPSSRREVEARRDIIKFIAKFCNLYKPIIHDASAGAVCEFQSKHKPLD